jgi:hypothetical protein
MMTLHVFGCGVIIFALCSQSIENTLHVHVHNSKTKLLSFVHALCCHCRVANKTCSLTHQDATTQMQQINKQFPLKAGSVGDPDVCLGAELRKVTLENGVKAWSISPSKHLEEVVKNVKNVKNHLQEKEPGRPWLKKATMPFPKDC